MTALTTALCQIPIIIADNGGYDSTELVTQLRAKYPAGGDAGGWTCIREKSQT
jgi:T-complex protein 1 subunit beta